MQPLSVQPRDALNREILRCSVAILRLNEVRLSGRLRSRAVIGSELPSVGLAAGAGEREAKFSCMPRVQQAIRAQQMRLRLSLEL